MAAIEKAEAATAANEVGKCDIFHKISDGEGFKRYRQHSLI